MRFYSFLVVLECFFDLPKFEMLNSGIVEVLSLVLLRFLFINGRLNGDGEVKKSPLKITHVVIALTAKEICF